MIDLKESRPEFEKLITHLSEELSGIRTGRAHTSLVENILVDSYGSPTPIKHIASLSIPDSRTILITPWDASMTKEIEKGITIASIGAQPTSDGVGVRISLPQLTEENRRALVKGVGQKQEQTKINIRLLRDRLRDEIAKAEKDNEITEDDKFGMQKELDEMTKEYGAQADAIAQDKEKEIMTI
ncbi:MAG: ribosome recycling factor [Candidatus Uhrbacteria bacterium]|nr:ribosome recycling factor [Candidatus Uhrbacteria bacterium]